MTDSKKRRLAKKRRLEELQAGNIKSKTNDIVLRDDERSWMHVVGSFARENDELKFKLDSLQKEFQKYRTHIVKRQLIGNTDPTKKIDELILRDGTIVDREENIEQYKFERIFNEIPFNMNGQEFVIDHKGDFKPIF